MKKMTSLILISMIALFQSCSTPARSVAQEKKKNNLEEKKHHYPTMRHIDRH